ncbi:MAG TPA: cell division protein FtsL [Candidatus Wallbacteria bacterium]|nr:MAG: Cell division protein FtsL [bacterium ADurb.Bin243]HPG58997.1 cell division protein FtsL [Candidatus Wallbacteria bacterium]
MIDLTAGRTDNNDIALKRQLSIKKIAQSRKNLVFFYILIAILLCTMVLAYVWSFVKMVEIRVGLNKLNDEYKKIVKERDNLIAERAKLSAMNRIEQIARTQLMMNLPTQVEYVSLLQPREGTEENAVDKGRSE